MKQGLSAVLLLGIVCVLPVLATELDLERVEAALATERPNIEARSPFIPSYLLDGLRSLSAPQLDRLAKSAGVDTGILRRGLQKIDSMERYRQRLANEGLLLDSGCLQARAGGFEWALLDLENPQASLKELAGLAYGVVIATVTEVGSGYYKGLGTRVVARVEEVIGESPLNLKQKDRIEYFQGYYTIEVGEVEICAERPGFQREKPGERVLLLAAPPTSNQTPETLVPSLVFPILDGKVVLQPFSFLVGEDPVYVDALRGELLEAEVPHG